MRGLGGKPRSEPFESYRDRLHREPAPIGLAVRDRRPGPEERDRPTDVERAGDHLRDARLNLVVVFGAFEPELVQAKERKQRRGHGAVSLR